MKIFDIYEFGFFIEEIKRDLMAIESGAHVFNGMMHKDGVVRLLRHVVRTMEGQSEKMNKYVLETERLAGIGKAMEYLLNCRHPMGLATREQISCTYGGVYVTDIESIMDLYNGLSNGESED